MKNTVTNMTLAAAFALAMPAQAATLSLTYDSSAAGYRSVTIDAVDVDVAGGNSRVAAGGFNMVDSTAGGLGAFIAWCVDLGAFLGTSGSHDYAMTDTPFGNGGETILGAGMDRVLALFNANYGEAITASRDASAAFQLALWEVVYDGDFDLDNGVFQASASDTVADLAGGYLTSASGYTGANLWDISYLESTAANRRQNLVTAEAVPSVPLPASAAMLLMAIGALALGRKRS